MLGILPYRSIVVTDFIRRLYVLLDVTIKCDDENTPPQKQAQYPRVEDMAVTYAPKRNPTFSCLGRIWFTPHRFCTIKRRRTHATPLPVRERE